MTLWIAGSGGWLLHAALQTDSLVTKTVAQRGTFETLTGIASIVISLALVTLAIGLLPAAWNFRSSYKKVNELLEKVYGDITPLVRHAHTIADNLDYISTSIRVDIQQVNQTIATANERLLGAVKQTEQRVTEFNALIGLVQREAEDVFVSTAAALRGVRTGASIFGAGASRNGDDENLPEMEIVEIEEIGASDDALEEDVTMLDDADDAFDAEDMSDGDDSAHPSVDGEERPRIRPRRRAGRRA